MQHIIPTQAQHVFISAKAESTSTSCNKNNQFCCTLGGNRSNICSPTCKAVLLCNFVFCITAALYVLMTIVNASRKKLTRYIFILQTKGICGLTREVAVGLLANLESRGLRRVEFVTRGLPPQHLWTLDRCQNKNRNFASPSFNKPSGLCVAKRLDKANVSRRADPGVFVTNRALLPQKGQLTVRAQFHRTPVALPPSPP